MAGGINQQEDDNAEIGEINVTPFIDVMLVLLIIFMVAAPLATVDIAVDLPSAAAEPQPRPADPIYVTIKGDQSLALGDQPVTLQSLPGALAALAKREGETRIFLMADQSVPYGRVMETMNALRRAGYLKVALVGLDAGGKP